MPKSEGPPKVPPRDVLFAPLRARVIAGLRGGLLIGAYAFALDVILTLVFHRDTFAVAQLFRPIVLLVVGGSVTGGLYLALARYGNTPARAAEVGIGSAAPLGLGSALWIFGIGWPALVVGVFSAGVLGLAIVMIIGEGLARRGSNAR